MKIIFKYRFIITQIDFCIYCKNYYILSLFILRFYVFFINKYLSMNCINHAIYVPAVKYDFRLTLCIFYLFMINVSQHLYVRRQHSESV